jgi:aryl-alcohol dehydrogenase-like predicted oxidoreductase
MAQVALAWLLARGDNIMPIPGTKRRKYLEENAAAVDITLSDAEVKALEQAFPPQAAAGLRYPEFQLKMMGI